MQNEGELSMKQRLFWFFPVLFCFLIPFGSLVLSGILVLWGLVSFFNMDVRQLKIGIKKRELQLLVAFLLLTAISAIFSKNKSEALFNIENKMSFLIIPYYVFCFHWSPVVIKKCINAFVSGCFFACFYLIARATVLYFQGQPEYFFYNQFSDFVHPAAFTMYLVLALCFLVIYYPKWFGAKKSYMYVTAVFALTFIVTIFLNSSKIGILSFFIAMPALVMYQLRDRLNIKKIALILVVFIGIVLLSMKLFPTTYERIQAVINFSAADVDKTSGESTAVRYLIWEQCVQIIKENFLFGVTVGDANDALVKAYENNGLTGALSHKLNAHNQFFQTFIGLGILGFLLLLFITFGTLIKGFIQKNFLLSIFAFVIILNFLVESMFQRSDGTLFIIFFYCILNRENILNELE
jgi:O-antigen ligase